MQVKSQMQAGACKRYFLMADRIIPLTPGPEATLGPDFKVDLPRPRDRAAINHNKSFIALRNEINKYLIKLKQDHEKLSDRMNLVCPDIQPIDLRVMCK